VNSVQRKVVVVVGAGSGIGAATAAYAQVDLRHAATVEALCFRLMAEGMLPRLREGGSIVAVASIAGLASQQTSAELGGLLRCTTADEVAQWQSGQEPNYLAYSTSKEALIPFAKRLATTAWSQHRVRVDTVSPGSVETPILRDLEQTVGTDVLDFAHATVGRHATVVDIAPVIDFLASPESSWVVGQDIQVDGGFANSMMTSAPIAS
jgi:NAD(P)-dependent dehydrogenase (short-subunit alcohol dehydrogenase family)